MRFFIEKGTAHDLFMEEPELRDELRLSPKMSMFVQTEHWQHPDVAGQKKHPKTLASVAW
jgi:hypothetical protein